MSHILTQKRVLIYQLQSVFNKIQLLKRFLKEHYFKTLAEFHYFLQNFL